MNASTAPIGESTKRRLQHLTDAQLADEVGVHKAEIAASEEKLDALKAEGVRRGLLEFDGDLFHCTLTPPGSSQRINKPLLLAVFGKPFVDLFSTTTAGKEWTLRCYGRGGKRAQTDER